MRKRDLIRIIESARIFKMYDDGAVPGVIDCLLEDVRRTLRCDPCLSRLTGQEFDALLAAFADGARRLLGEYVRIEWECAAPHVDWEYAARVVTDAVIDGMNHDFGADDGGEQ
jgi:hypothetical protein